VFTVQRLDLWSVQEAGGDLGDALERSLVLLHLRHRRMLNQLEFHRYTRVAKRTKPNGATAWYCRNKHRMYSRGPSTLGLHGKTRAQMSDACERCGFEPEIEQQLEIHHKDQNPGNNIPENLQTLCANCHRFVHFAKAAEVAA
jgi:predicted HNH restriction endonuclease